MKTDKLPLLGVAGEPVFHSLSPPLFSEIFGFPQAKGNYVRINGSKAENLIGLFENIPFSGMNVTTPLKTEILKHLKYVDPVAKKIGAVNVVVNLNGVIKGFNTDYIGVVNSLYYKGYSIEGKRCLVLGAGGAARAAAYGLQKKGGDVILSNRNNKRGQKVAKTIGIGFCNVKDIGKALKNIDIVVDTLPSRVDLVGDKSEKYNFVFLKADYREEDEIGKEVKSKGRVLTGLDWLFFQGVASFELFFGEKITFVEQKYKKFKNSALKKTSVQSVFIVGFTGCGKSVVGKILSGKTGLKYIDMDGEIEKREGCSVKEIFKKKGELYFRRLESRILSEFVNKKGIICSCGGGVVETKANREFMKNIPVVWIHTDLSIITDRIDSGSRPVLSGLDRTEIKELYKNRTNLYAEVADILVGNNSSAEETAEKIQSEIF